MSRSFFVARVDSGGLILSCVNIELGKVILSLCLSWGYTSRRKSRERMQQSSGMYHLADYSCITSHPTIYLTWTPFDDRPERWDNISSESLKDIPSGVYSHLMIFLGGPHACVGWRFSLVEYVHLWPLEERSMRGLLIIFLFLFFFWIRMKAILFVLRRRFEFSLAVPRKSIVSRSAVVSRPYVKGSKQPELPLNIKLASESWLNLIN
jgi:hypothetical protein